ncbi:MAG: TonB-dependent receptor, partial [Rhodothermales bacterium]|nr:TonB-dependent receptor [Rhodothermales bacterium]
TWDTIDQQNVEVDGERRRQRINLEGSRVLGLELVGNVDPGGVLSARYSATVSSGRALGDTDRERLVEKPGTLLSLGLTAAPRGGSTLSAEFVYTGDAYGLDPDNVLVELPDVLHINVRASMRHYTSGGLFGEIFLRLDNLTDRSVFPQLGLPGPGRTVQVGLSLAW